MLSPLFPAVLSVSVRALIALYTACSLIRWEERGIHVCQTLFSLRRAIAEGIPALCFAIIYFTDIFRTCIGPVKDHVVAAVITHRMPCRMVVAWTLWTTPVNVVDFDGANSKLPVNMASLQSAWFPNADTNSLRLPLSVYEEAVDRSPCASLHTVSCHRFPIFTKAQQHQLR